MYVRKGSERRCIQKGSFVHLVVMSLVLIFFLKKSNNFSKCCDNIFTITFMEVRRFGKLKCCGVTSPLPSLLFQAIRMGTVQPSI